MVHYPFQDVDEEEQLWRELKEQWNQNFNFVEVVILHHCFSRRARGCQGRQKVNITVSQQQLASGYNVRQQRLIEYLSLVGFANFRFIKQRIPGEEEGIDNWRFTFCYEYIQQ